MITEVGSLGFSLSGRDTPSQHPEVIVIISTTHILIDFWDFAVYECI